MTPLIVALSLFLSANDPFGWSLYQWFQARTYEVSPIVRDRQQYSCYTSWNPREEAKIECDFNILKKLLGDSILFNQWTACVLVHEAIHARYRVSSEELPLVYQYVCLDRVGAPQWMKDQVYERLVPKPTTDDED